MRNGVKYAVMLLLLLALPAVTPALEKQPQIESEIMMKTGDKLHLFHSGTADVPQRNLPE